MPGKACRAVTVLNIGKQRRAFIEENVKHAEIIVGQRQTETKSAALFVRASLNTHDPKLLANSAKHFAFNRCGEFNLYGVVDAQLAVVEDELLASNTLVY